MISFMCTGVVHSYRIVGDFKRMCVFVVFGFRTCGNFVRGTRGSCNTMHSSIGSGVCAAILARTYSLDSHRPTFGDIAVVV